LTNADLCSRAKLKSGWGGENTIHYLILGIYKADERKKIRMDPSDFDFLDVLHYMPSEDELVRWFPDYNVFWIIPFDPKKTKKIKV